MRRLFLLLPVLALLNVCSCAQRVFVQPSVDVTRYDRVAILPFETDSVLSTIGTHLADEIVFDLVKKAPSLDVIERTRIEALLQEQNLARQGAIDPQSAVSVGRMLGVRAMVTGSLSVSVGTLEISPASAQRVATGTAIMRVIDTETGKIVWSDREESQYGTFLGNPNEPAWAVKTDQEMIQRVIQDLAESLAQAFYPHFEWK